MSRLYPTLQMKDGESPTSFISRLALLHRSQSLSVFALDMGLQCNAIINGESKELAQLARLSGVPLDTLTGNAIRKEGNNFFYRGQMLTASSLWRTGTQGCPKCLEEDLTEGPEAWRAAGRTVWQMSYYRVCERHLVRLANINAKLLVSKHDFARRAAPGLPCVQALAQQAEATQLTRLELYLNARREGIDASPWLDSLPFYVAWRTCEVIGAISVHGRDITTRWLTGEDWRRAGDVGYAIAHGGLPSIHQFLAGLVRKSPSGNDGPKAWFGQFFKWLDAMRGDPNYDGVRDTLINYIAETAPIGADDRVFGKQVVTTRKFHSISTAVRESSIHPLRFRRVIRAAGITTSASDRLSDNLVTFSVKAVEPLLDLLDNSINMVEAGKIIGTTDKQTIKLLESGLIQKIAERDALELGKRCFDRREIKGFLDRLMANTVEVDTALPGQYPIRLAARRALCSATCIVDLILKNRLAWVGSMSSGRGYGSILVNVAEVKHLIRGLPER